MARPLTHPVTNQTVEDDMPTYRGPVDAGGRMVGLLLLRSSVGRRAGHVDI